MRRGRRRALWIRYRWPFLAGVTLAGLVLGYVGYDRYGQIHHDHFSVIDTLYNDLSLFGPLLPIPGPVPWELQIARYLVPAAVLYGVVSGVMVLFRDRFEQARLPFLRGHVVVAGAGVKGLAFVKALRDEHRTVVVVGDATDPDILDVAGIRRARHLVATAGDAANVELAMQARQMKQTDTGPTLECLAHVVDPELCTLLKRQALMDAGGGTFRLDFFNFHDHAARRACESARRPGDRVVTIGEGLLTDQIVVHATAPDGLDPEPLDVTVTGADASTRIAALTAHHPHLVDTVRLHPLEVPPDVAALRASGVLDVEAGPATVYVADLDDETSLAVVVGDVGPVRTHQHEQDVGLRQGVVEDFDEVAPGRDAVDVEEDAALAEVLRQRVVQVARVRTGVATSVADEDVEGRL